MVRKILLSISIILLIFLCFVFTRDDRFNYERNGLINSSPDEIYPYISNFRMGSLWSPFEKIDPHMKRNFIGPDAQIGSIMEFEGNKEAGSGKLEILKLVPNELVEIKLVMTKPFYAENVVQYHLKQEGSATRFTWTMSGKNGFFGKLISVFIDCEKMIGDQFTRGIENLKTVVETKDKR